MPHDATLSGLSPYPGVGAARQHRAILFNPLGIGRLAAKGGRTLNGRARLPARRDVELEVTNCDLKRAPGADVVTICDRIRGLCSAAGISACRFPLTMRPPRRTFLISPMISMIRFSLAKMSSTSCSGGRCSRASAVLGFWMSRLTDNTFPSLCRVRLRRRRGIRQDHVHPVAIADLIKWEPASCFRGRSAGFPARATTASISFVRHPERPIWVYHEGLSAKQGDYPTGRIR
jgi:hypothetical protein